MCCEIAFGVTPDNVLMEGWREEETAGPRGRRGRVTSSHVFGEGRIVELWSMVIED